MVPKWRFNNFLNLKNLFNLVLHMYYEILGFQIRCKKIQSLWNQGILHTDKNWQVD